MVSETDVMMRVTCSMFVPPSRSDFTRNGSFGRIARRSSTQVAARISAWSIATACRWAWRISAPVRTPSVAPSASVTTRCWTSRVVHQRRGLEQQGIPGDSDQRRAHDGRRPAATAPLRPRRRASRKSSSVTMPIVSLPAGALTRIALAVGPGHGGRRHPNRRVQPARRGHQPRRVHRARRQQLRRLHLGQEARRASPRSSCGPSCP